MVERNLNGNNIRENFILSYIYKININYKFHWKFYIK